jgi:hypothetical protein
MAVNKTLGQIRVDMTNHHTGDELSMWFTPDEFEKVLHAFIDVKDVGED